MMTRFVILLLFLGLASAIRLDEMFFRYADTDSHHLDEAAYYRLWFDQFDPDDDGNITRLEFDKQWRALSLSHEEATILFFLRLDRVPDEVLTVDDFHHTFHLFDIDNSGEIDHREFRASWDALFE